MSHTKINKETDQLVDDLIKQKANPKLEKFNRKQLRKLAAIVKKVLKEQ